MAARVEEMVRDRLRLQVDLVVARLNRANLREEVSHPADLGTALGQQEALRRIAESRLAANEFGAAIGDIKKKAVAAMSDEDIDPSYKKEYLAGISQGMWRGMAVPQCESFCVTVDRCFTGVENLVAFMARADYEVQDEQILFHKPSDARDYDYYLGAAKAGFSQVNREGAELQARLRKAA